MSDPTAVARRIIRCFTFSPPFATNCRPCYESPLWGTPNRPTKGKMSYSVCSTGQGCPLGKDR
jgi:hypothetical protein